MSDVSQFLPAHGKSVHLDSDTGRCQVVEVQIWGDMLSQERSCTSRGTVQECWRRKPSSALHQDHSLERAPGSPSSLELLSSRIWCVNSLLTNRHSNCPYKTNSLRFMALRICSAFCNTAPHGKSSTPGAPGHGQNLEHQAGTTGTDPLSCAPRTNPSLSISCNFLFHWPLFWHFPEDALTTRSWLFICGIRAG